MHSGDILVIRLSSIGDVVLCRPALEAFKAHHPSAAVVFITSKAYVQLVASWQLATGVVPVDEAEAIELSHGVRVIDLQKNRKSRAALSFFKSRTVSYLNKENALKWLIVNLKSRQTVPHIVSRYCKALGVPSLGMASSWRLPASPAATAPAYIVVVLGAAHATKAIPSALLAELVRSSAYPVKLLGGENEKALGSALESAGVENLAGKTSLLVSAAVLKEAQYVISADTGMAHISAQLGTPTVVVWGSTTPQFGMMPWGSHVVSVEKSLPCRPCSKIGSGACPLGHHACMEHSAAHIHAAGVAASFRSWSQS